MNHAASRAPDGRPAATGEAALDVRTGVRFVVFRAGRILGALPVRWVIESMRPFRIDPLPGMAACVLGVSTIRGKATAVIDARRMLASDSGSPPARLLLLRVSDRSIALAVDEVFGLRSIDPTTRESLPPLLGAAASGLVAELGQLDGDLLLLLDGARLLPDADWLALEARLKP